VGTNQNLALDRLKSNIAAFKAGNNHNYLETLNVVALYSRGNLTRKFDWNSNLKELIEDKTSTENQQMGNPNTLSALITRALLEYPDTYYLLSIANHGRGTTGISWDGNDYLTPTEIYNVLSDIFRIKKLDILFYDASLMQTLEEAYQVYFKTNTQSKEPQISFLIGYENLGYGLYAYDEYAKLTEGVPLPEDLAKYISGTYYNDLPEKPLNISVLDLSEMDRVINALNLLSDKILTTQAKQCFVDARVAAQKFDAKNYYTLDNNDAYIDLYDFAQKLKTNCSGVVASSAHALLENLDKFIVANYRRSGKYNGYDVWNLDNSRGVAIYFPSSANDYDLKAYLEGTIFRFNTVSRWDELLQDHFGPNSLRTSTESFPGVPPMLNPSVSVPTPTSSYPAPSLFENFKNWLMAPFGLKKKVPSPDFSVKGIRQAAENTPPSCSSLKLNGIEGDIEVVAGTPVEISSTVENWGIVLVGKESEEQRRIFFSCTGSGTFSCNFDTSGKSGTFIVETRAYDSSRCDQFCGVGNDYGIKDTSKTYCSPSITTCLDRSCYVTPTPSVYPAECPDKTQVCCLPAPQPSTTPTPTPELACEELKLTSLAYNLKNTDRLNATLKTKNAGLRNIYISKKNEDGSWGDWVLKGTYRSDTDNIELNLHEIGGVGFYRIQARVFNPECNKLCSPFLLSESNPYALRGDLFEVDSCQQDTSENQIGNCTNNCQVQFRVTEEETTWTFIMYGGQPSLQMQDGHLCIYLYRPLKEKLNILARDQSFRENYHPYINIVYFYLDFHSYLWEWGKDEDQPTFKEKTRFMGLSELVRYSKEKYPATYYFLAPIDHGFSLDGIAHFMPPPVLAGEVAGSSPIDVLFYHACLMGTIESMYDVKDYAQYMIVNQNYGFMEFGDTYINSLKQLAPGTNPQELAEIVFDNYASAVETMDCEPEDSADPGCKMQVSLLNLPKAEAVKAQIDSLAQKLIDLSKTKRKCIEKTWNKTQKFDTSGMGILNESDYFVDLYDLGSKLKEECGEDIASEANRLIASVRSFVLKNKVVNENRRDSWPTYSLKGANGISIVFPTKKIVDAGLNQIYPNGFRFKESSWIEFLRTYFPNFRLGQQAAPEFKTDSVPLINGETGRFSGRYGEAACKPCPDLSFAPKNTASYDCNSASFDFTNYLLWKGQASRIKKGETIPEDNLYADYNCDGKVNNKDAAVWLGHFLTRKK